MEAAKENGGTVQHVTKASSDQLLRKFAEMGSEPEAAKIKELRLAKRRKRTLQPKVDIFSEKNFLLPLGASRRFGIGKSKLKARDLNNRSRSLFGTIEKTWRRTVQGASKVFIEKHYNRHRRLISDTEY